MRRRGTLYLIVVLPDGSRSMVPSTWTDFDPGNRNEDEEPAAVHTIGSIRELMHARTVVDALLRRLANNQPGEEVERATTDIRVSEGDGAAMGRSRRDCASEARREACASDSESSLTRSGEGRE